MSLIVPSRDLDRPPPADVTRQRWSDVPWRTIIGSVAVVFVTYLGVIVILATLRIITWALVAGFLAIVLSRPVRFVQQRVRGRRTLATGIVLFTTVAVIVGLISIFILPVRTQLTQTLSDLPGTVTSAAEGRGPFGKLVTQLHLEKVVRDNEATLRKSANDVSSFKVVQSAVEVALSVVTVFVMTFLFLSQAAIMGAATQRLIPEKRRPMLRRAAKDASAAISGYMLGNLVISAFAGVAGLLCMAVLGVPNALVLALWVAIADLIPLVGATLGAAVAVIAAFLHSTTAGVISIVFFVLYQQFENSVLQVWVMSRTVKINPLVVLLSVLVGIEVFGFLGALLAIPVAGAVQVGIKALNTERHRERLVLPDHPDG